MSEERENLFLGFEVGTGKEVSIPIFHMLLTGQTRLSGKTTALKALAKRAAEKGFKILVLDSKSNFEDYSSFGHKVPVCLRQTIDSLPLLELLESIFDRKISQYFGTLVSLTEDAEDYDDVIAKAEERKATADGFEKSACITIVDLLRRLKEQTLQVDSTSELTLPYDINRMTINQFDLEGQHLIANSVFKQALTKYPKMIIVLDEANKFLPQRRKTACTDAITLYVTQGGVTHNYLWLASQFLATTSKDAMKAMAVKLLGRQDQTHEVGHTLDLVPDASQILRDSSVMRLKLGHFVFVDIDSTVRTVYVAPEDASLDDCRKVAAGTMDPKEIHYEFHVPASEVSEELAKEMQTLTPHVEPSQEKNETDLSEIQNQIERLVAGLSTLTTRITGIETRMKSLQEDVTQVVVSKAFKTKVKYEEMILDTLETSLFHLGKTGFLKDWCAIREIMSELEKVEIRPKQNALATALNHLVDLGIMQKRKYGGHQNQYKFGSVIFEEEEKEVKEAKNEVKEIEEKDEFEQQGSDDSES